MGDAAAPLALAAPTAARSSRLAEKLYLPSALLSLHMPSGLADVRIVPRLQEPDDEHDAAERLEEYMVALTEMPSSLQVWKRCSRPSWRQAARGRRSFIVPSSMRYRSSKCLKARFDYWTYEVCPSQRVRQFATTDDGLRFRNEFSLGHWLEDRHGHGQDGDAEILAQEFAGGTEGRSSTVLYVCPASQRVSEDGILAVREPSMLVYVITAHISALCSHPMDGLTRGAVLPSVQTSSTGTDLNAYGLALLLCCLPCAAAAMVRWQNVWRWICQRWARRHPIAGRRPPATGRAASSSSQSHESGSRRSPSLPVLESDLERVAECVVCLEPIVRSAIGSCAHHFCVQCLLECCRYNPICPKCQTTIRDVWLDPEFDSLLKLARMQEPQSLPPERSSQSNAALERYIVHLQLPRGACAGITL